MSHSRKQQPVISRHKHYCSSQAGLSLLVCTAVGGLVVVWALLIGHTKLFEPKPATAAARCSRDWGGEIVVPVHGGARDEAI
jgi:hypothetical protein